MWEMLLRLSTLAELKESYLANLLHAGDDTSLGLVTNYQHVWLKAEG